MKVLFQITTAVVLLLIGIMQNLYAEVNNGVKKSPYGSYIIVMELDPAVKYQGNIQGYPATKASVGKKFNSQHGEVKKYTELLRQTHVNTLQNAGISATKKVHDYVHAINGFSALITHQQAIKLSKQKGVMRVIPDEMRFKTTDSSPDFLGLTNPGSPWSQGYKGEGIVVGVIDSGIWPEHPSFADDGSYSAPPVTLAGNSCDFGNSEHNPLDLAFECNNKLIGARQILDTYRAIEGAEPDEYDSARDDDGHGTHTASTAAGNAGVEAQMFGIPRGTISGIAPRAHVIAYKGLGNMGGFGSDLAAAIDQAVADGVDVINYSVGGGASLTGADDLAFLFAADAGVFVATSAGNDGPGAGTIGGPASVPWLTTVGANTQTRMFQGTVVLGDESEYTGASITEGVGPSSLIDAEFAGGDLCVPGTLTAAVEGKIVLCRRGAIARVDKSEAVRLAGGVGMIMYNNNDVDNLNSDNHAVPSVHIDNTPGLAIKAYIAGGSATASINCCENGEWDSAPSMAIFSSRGSNTVAEDIIKPDITAPGHMILAGNSPTPDPGQVAGELFQSISGTSMSSPHIAGIFALMKQAHPDWSPAMAKSALMTSAYQDVRDNDRSSLAGPFAMGAGHVNVGGEDNETSVLRPGLVYNADFFDYLGFLCDAEPSALDSETCDLLELIGVPTDASDLNLASIGIAELPGSQTITRTLISVDEATGEEEEGGKEYKVETQAPAGYQVEVSPDTIRLESGESASYQVTFTNTGAPNGEWRFGSLTWRETTGQYEVYSPIAVRGAPFSAPANISGNGRNGSSSFDINFGYSGSYSANAHGLVAARVKQDTVGQDPDQSFDPADGHSDAHVIAVSNALFLRLAIPPEAVAEDIDLDVYVFDPTNTLVAASTLIGTDEVIEITDPMDGNWTVYVHGWLTFGEDADYSLYHWLISAKPGGNLTLEDVPESATLGETATIEANWTGAIGGTGIGMWFFGAVSHTDASGPMGLTLLEVDNR
ncbi:S8 family peptidase [Thalassomonas viridans]|uniref:S8 family peptidase n=1 Tax=Thalassomonas viridans TaxID=137584 RepID=A0AAF0CAX3_9GAMM|nr:S8 family peptidase [Thalassomonas viridans]WDE09087.1 S8 family peptidase [Thalassomonas viridans]